VQNHTLIILKICVFTHKPALITFNAAKKIIYFLGISKSPLSHIIFFLISKIPENNPMGKAQATQLVQILKGNQTMRQSSGNG